MRRSVLICFLALGGASAASASVDPAPVKLRGFVCQSAIDPGSRATSVTAAMRPQPGTQKLAMRFELLKQNRRHGRAISLTGSKLKTWLTPKDPTLGTLPADKWIVKHPVADLAAPALYHFKV